MVLNPESEDMVEGLYLQQARADELLELIKVVAAKGLHMKDFNRIHEIEEIVSFVRDIQEYTFCMASLEIVKQKMRNPFGVLFDAFRSIIDD